MPVRVGDEGVRDGQARHSRRYACGERWLVDLAGRFEDAGGRGLFHRRWIVITDIEAGRRQRPGHFRYRRAAGGARCTLRSGLVVDTRCVRNSLCGRGVTVLGCHRGEITCAQSPFMRRHGRRPGDLGYCQQEQK
jgi:hypothetical protein